MTKIVDIFQDPITRINKEGSAKLIKRLDAAPEEVRGGRLEYWQVAFIVERGRLERERYERWVFIAE